MTAFSDTDKEIARLAIPAFGALIAEPLYVLVDTAVIGHLGTSELGGLALASQVLLSFHAITLFLAFGTTASVSRFFGARRDQQAAEQAVQGIWLAVGLGLAGVCLLYISSDPLLKLLGGEAEVLENAKIYLRISLLGLPPMLVTLACVGYLRGIQNTTRPLVVALVSSLVNLVIELILIYGFDQGIGASALATVIAQWGGAILLVRWVTQSAQRHGAPLVPKKNEIRKQARVAGDLFVRTAALRGSFLIAAATAARLSEVDLGAHEITFQFWMFIALALDAVAIAGQAITGRLLGGGDIANTRFAAKRMLQWNLAIGMAAGGIVLLARPWIPTLFSQDPAVVELATFLFLHLALMQPLNGVVFALDGILIGAGDMRFLAWAMVGPAAVFTSSAILVNIFQLGIGWLWAAIWALMISRATILLWRFKGNSWMVTGEGPRQQS